MSSRIALAIDASMPAAALYRTMAGRIGRIEIVDDVQSCAVFVTHSASSALHRTTGGTHSLLIDPFSIPAEVRSQLLASERTGPAHSARFQPAIRQVKRTLDEGRLGDPGLLRIHCWHAAAEPMETSLARELDLALWMFGGRPAEVYAVRRAGFLQAHLGFPDGGMTLIDIDQSVPADSSYYSLSLIGSTGAAYADDHHNMNLQLGAQGISAVRVSQQEIRLARMIEEFAEAIHRNSTYSVSWEDTNASLELAAVVLSAASDERVLTPEEIRD